MFIEISKNILTHKSKIIGNFSTREVVCGGLGLTLAGFLGFGGVLGSFSDKTRLYISLLCATPIFAVGFVTLYGQPLEKIIPIIIKDNFLLPMYRYYKTEFKSTDINKIFPKFDDDGNLIKTVMPQEQTKKKKKTSNSKKKKKIIPSKNQEYKGYK